jgi:hypothetical protein
MVVLLTLLFVLDLPLGLPYLCSSNAYVLRHTPLPTYTYISTTYILFILPSSLLFDLFVLLILKPYLAIRPHSFKLVLERTESNPVCRSAC